MATDALNRDIEQLVQALQVLASDVQAAAQLSHMNDTQFTRRTYVRAAFALFEGNINLMTEVILAAMDRQDIQALPLKTLEILRQEEQKLDQNGLPIVHIKFRSFHKRIAPVFKSFSQLYGKSFQIDKSTAGWVDFKAAIEIRNRITHPKNAANFVITDCELNTVQRAKQWFANSVEALLNECD
ncbi:MAG: hypothetical protein KDK04_19525 [Candidatus Competibacteraceae bacterium]|nr:hypothetical protein [Candidatus Competibacteraceae bacterium]